MSRSLDRPAGARSVQPLALRPIAPQVDIATRVVTVRRPPVRLSPAANGEPHGILRQPMAEELVKLRDRTITARSCYLPKLQRAGPRALLQNPLAAG